MSQVTRIALWRCSLNVFVFVIVFVFVFVFVIVFFLVRSCLLITLIKCLKGHKSIRLLFVCQLVKYCDWVSQSVSDKVTYRAVWGQLKILARLGVSRTIYVNLDSPNLYFQYFNFKGRPSVRKTSPNHIFIEIAQCSFDFTYFNYIGFYDDKSEWVSVLSEHNCIFGSIQVPEVLIHKE